MRQARHACSADGHFVEKVERCAVLLRQRRYIAPADDQASILINERRQGPEMSVGGSGMIVGHIVGILRGFARTEN